jgi:hypothetical protein
MVARLRRSPAPLNPYVVLADVAINMMLILCLLFVVSASMRDAHFESVSREFGKRAERQRTLWRVKQQLKRNGQNIELQFHSGDWFQSSSDQLSQTGEHLARELAGLIVDPAPRAPGSTDHPIGMIHVTVTQEPGVAPGLDYRRATALRAALEARLRIAGHQWPFLASGRVQDLENDREALRNEVDVVLTLRQPEIGS